MTRLDDRWYTRAFGAHYPLLYQHRNDAEAEQCLDLLPRLAPLTWRPDQEILDLGCGDGRHLEILSRRGIPAVGLDLSPHLLLSAGKRLAAEAKPALVRGDMRHLPFQDKTFASVLSLFTAFGYFGPPAANGEPICQVARVLQPGGHWFLDYFDGERVRRDLSRPEGSLVRVREMGPVAVREERRFDPDSSQVTKHVRLAPLEGCFGEAAAFGVPAEGLDYTESVAVFTLEELDSMAAREGLVRVAAAGGYLGETLGQGDRWILVFRKAPKDDMV